MLKIIGLLALHVICINFLGLLWKDKNEVDKRGGVLTKLGYVSQRKLPRLFRFSMWVDFIVVLLLYIVLIAYSLWLVFL
jgi:hypothetical protein